MCQCLLLIGTWLHGKGERIGKRGPFLKGDGKGCPLRTQRTFNRAKVYRLGAQEMMAFVLADTALHIGREIWPEQCVQQRGERKGQQVLRRCDDEVAAS